MSSETPRVLIVDDSRAMRRIQRQVVAQLGDVDIVEAGDAVEAVRAMKAHEFAIDLILLDWVMPRMSGLELARRLKDNPNTARIPILMVTSLSRESQIREAIRSGVNGYLLKPFTREMLLRSILALSPGHAAVAAELADDTVAPTESFLQRLSSEMYTRILQLATVVHAELGSTIIGAGDEVTTFYFVLDGRVVEQHEREGQRSNAFGPGECFGVVEMMASERPQQAFVAAKASRIACLDKPDFETLLLNYPEINIALSRYVAAKSRELDIDEDATQDLHGSLGVLDLPGLIEALNLRQSTGRLDLEELGAAIEIQGGRVVRARHPQRPPEDGVGAFCQIVLERPQHFRFHPQSQSGVPNITLNTTELLLEAMRQADESGEWRAS